MSLYRDEAVVLRSWKLGEADRIVSLHTLDHGKVRAVAKGVRRTKSRFGGRLEATSRVAIQLYRGKGDLDTITQVETLGRHSDLHHNSDRFARASAMLEAIDQISPDREPNRAVHTLLVRALDTLSRDDSPLVVAGFFFKLLAYEGVLPELDQCVACSGDGPFVSIDMVEGGVRCQSCRQGRPVSPEALDLMRQIVGGQLGQALAQPVSGSTSEVDILATVAMEAHLERRLRSVAVLEQRSP